jgi:dsRNA-specific ribonuclease
MLTKNYFLAKLICLFGFHRYILFHRNRQMTHKEIKEAAAKEAAAKGGVLDQWKIQKKVKDFMNEKDADKFIQYSFRRNFNMNDREPELFEPPKILGDVFESLIGAIFIDGGIQKVLKVY